MTCTRFWITTSWLENKFDKTWNILRGGDRPVHDSELLVHDLGYIHQI